MSNNEQPNSLIVANLLDENKKIVVINSEHKTILEHIIKELNADEYNSIVTMENFASMDESAKKLGTTSKFISRFRIDKKDSEMSDIKIFDENLKGYCLVIDEQQQTIKDGLEVFKEETRKEILALCKEHLETYYEEVELREEFRKVNIEDMTLSKYATKAMKIAKPGKDEIEKRVNIYLTLQTKVDNRILSLENECYKAGIEPLTVEHIQGFLYEDDVTYNKQLQSLIDAEIARNKKVQEQAKIKAEKDAENKVIADQKALKDELHARYEGQIRTANIGELTRINIELKSYDDNATYALKNMCNNRQKELETPIKESYEEQVIDESPQEEHLKSIAQEPIKKQEVKPEIQKDGKVLKTLSIGIRVPESATDEQVVNAVIGMIKRDQFPLENIEVK